MDFYLQRTHYREGSNGSLFHKNKFLCFCIELPWRIKEPTVSCIPDGTYELVLSYSLNFGHHLLVKNVAKQSGILIYSKNTALSDLNRCIAPVTHLTGIGKGLGSRKALQNLLMRIEAFQEPNEAIFLTICSEHSGR